MGKKVIITGATGMVGKGVLLECLESPLIDQVLLVNRRSIKMEHPKIKEIFLQDFTQIDTLKDQIQVYDACFYCMGVSAMGLDEHTYAKITYNTTKAFADTLYSINPGMTFIYVSGTGTDSSEKGRLMWARVKGKTENMVFAKGFKKAYAFRPGFIIPEKGIKSATPMYNRLYSIFRPLFSLLKKSNSVTTTTRVGMAMIKSLNVDFDKNILENRDINRLAGG